MNGVFKSQLGQQIAAYVALNKSLGRRFYSETYVLAHLDRFLVSRRHAALTPTAFSAWTMTFVHTSPTVRRKRMSVVRRFCLHMRHRRPRCFVPDPREFPAARSPRRPYILSPEQIIAILRTATHLPARSTSKLQPEVFRLAIVLLYTTGLRRNEVVRLTLSDYSPKEKTLLVRASKFHKSRIVALSDSAAAEMDQYLHVRRRFSVHPDAPLLINNRGATSGYSGGGFGQAIRRLFREANVRTSDGRLPHVHDLRHTYAVHSLLRWYCAGADVQAKLPVLSTAMGHVSIVSTAYYLALLEPLATAASDRFELHCHGILATSERAR